MYSNYNELINYLKDNSEHVNSSELSSYFNVTNRTIRNWVKGINEHFDDEIIISDRNGYTLKKNIELQDDSSPSVRRSKILSLLIKFQDVLDIDDLVEEFFVSESTILNDIKLINLEIKNFHLSINSNNRTINLNGLEINKRKCIISMLNKEIYINNNLNFNLNNIFNILDLDYIKRMIRNTLLQEFKIIKNEYVIDNIAMHFAVTLDRVKSNNYINEIVLDRDLIKNEIDIVKSIAQKLYEKYSIIIPDSEIINLSVMFIGENRSNDFYENIFGEGLNQKLENIIEQVENTYFINLNENEIKSQLIMHLKNLLLRGKFNSFERNNFLDKIKTTYPLAFDIGLFMGSILEQEFKIKVPEEEISFIVLHLGKSIIYRIQKNEDYNILILTDKYLITKNDFNYMLNHVNFDYDIKLVEYINEQDLDSYDLIFSTNLVESEKDIVKLNPIITEYDLNIINKEISKLKSQKESKLIKEQIDKYINSKNYYNLDFSKLNSVSSLLENVYQQIKDYNGLGKDFLESLKTREDMSSTAFESGVAIPHSLEFYNLKSEMVVINLKRPIYWNDTKVYMIFVPIISYNDMIDFNEFFQSVIQVLYYKKNVNNLNASKNYEQFKKNLLKFLIEEK